MSYVFVYPVTPPASGFTAESGFTLTGTFTDGELLTLSGTGFGAKPNGAEPLFWYPFEADLNLSPLARGTHTVTYSGTRSTSNPAPNSTASLLTDLCQDTGHAVLITSGGYVLPGTDGPDHAYLMVKRKWDFNATTVGATNTEISGDFNNKHIRLYPAHAAAVPQGHAWIESTDTGQQTYDGTNQPTDYSDFTPSDVASTWITHEAVMGLGSVDTQDGIFDWYMNGRLANPATDRWYWRRTGYLSARSLYLDQLSNYAGTGNAPTYIDSVYIDDSWCRVILSDEPTWATGVGPTAQAYNREIQIPTQWDADGETIKFYLRQGSHSYISGKTLYVVPDTGTPIKIGTFQ